MNKRTQRTEICVRDATDADLPAISAVMGAATALLRKVYRPTAPAVARAKAMNVRWLLAERDGQVVGALRYWREEDRMHLGIGVHPDHHGRGVARRLTDALAEKARGQGLARLALYTVRQTDNVAIFRRLGFAAVREGPAVDLESATGEPLTEVYMERPLFPSTVNGQPA